MTVLHHPKLPMKPEVLEHFAKLNGKPRMRKVECIIDATTILIVIDDKWTVEISV